MIHTDNTTTLVNALSEIERLRAEVNQLMANGVWQATQIAALMDERDAYKASADEQVALVLELAAERDEMTRQMNGFDAMFAEVKELRAANKDLQDWYDDAITDAKRLDWFSRQTEAYGFEVHEGNGWRIAGPYATLREAIDKAIGEQS